MKKILKIFLCVSLFVFSSIGIAEQIATSFIFPVGNPNIPPTEETGNENGFVITQSFNTVHTYLFGKADGAWCNNPVEKRDEKTKIYASREDCENKGYRWIYGHTGVDLSNGATTDTVPIFAIANGKVIYSGDSGDGYGNKLKIKHTLPNGKIIYSLYAHRSSVMLVDNQDVVQGQVIGYVGTSGNVPRHLHFAIYDDVINPSDIKKAPVGYAYSDVTKILRYFYDPLLFINDRNSDVVNPQNNYVDASLRQDFIGFAESLGLGHAMRETYDGNLFGDETEGSDVTPGYYRAAMQFEKMQNGRKWIVTIWIEYLKNNPSVRKIQYFDPSTTMTAPSAWAPIM